MLATIEHVLTLRLGPVRRKARSRRRPSLGIEAPLRFLDLGSDLRQPLRVALLLVAIPEGNEAF